MRVGNHSILYILILFMLFCPKVFSQEKLELENIQPSFETTLESQNLSDDKEIKISVVDLFRFNDKNLIKQKWNAFKFNNLYYSKSFKVFSGESWINSSGMNSKKVKNKRNNRLLHQVNQRNFNLILKRNETKGIRIHQPNYQPYGGGLLP